jgi:hypothetical protein
MHFYFVFALYFLIFILDGLHLFFNMALYQTSMAGVPCGFALTMICARAYCSWNLRWKESSAKLKTSCTMMYISETHAILLLHLLYIYYILQHASVCVQNMCMRVSKQLLIWTQEQAYWVASRFLILGFELDLYSPSEYCMVYWYIYVVFTKLIEKIQLRILASSENCKFWCLFWMTLLTCEACNVIRSILLMNRVATIIKMIL